MTILRRIIFLKNFFKNKYQIGYSDHISNSSADDDQISTMGDGVKS